MVLSERAWRHIRERHPEVAPYRDLVERTIESPELIVKGHMAESKAVKHFPKTHLGSKYIVVVYREVSGQKRIITAYFTSSLRKVKGEIVWRI